MRQVSFDGIQHNPPLSGCERSQVVQCFGGQDDFIGHIVSFQVRIRSSRLGLCKKRPKGVRRSAPSSTCFCQANTLVHDGINPAWVYARQGAK
jgi:hypothetical protein